MILTAIDFFDGDLRTGVAATLDRTEELIRAAVTGVDPLVTGAARHLVDAGGKRFRPLLVALAARFGEPDAPERVTKIATAAAVCELTHLATLHHDDVMDEAKVRRGAPSVNARWGNTIAILTGDFLFSRAVNLAVDLGIEAVRIQAATFARLVHGQIAETSGPGPSEHLIDHHLRVITHKTGSLIATSARFGGYFAGVSREHVEVLAEFGETLGVAFQLSDDILDITSDKVQSGKTPGTDLREGVATLPVLYVLASDDPAADSVRLRQILSAGPVTDAQTHAEALGLLRESSAMKQARETAQSYCQRARRSLSVLPALPARAALESLCDFITDRAG